jgi:hypothetical protein
LLRGPSYWAEFLEGGNEGGAAVLETRDGFLVGGWTYPATTEGFRSTDMWLVKLDAEGSILSQHSYDGLRHEAIRRLLPAHAGGYVALARSTSFETNPETNANLLIKFDAGAENIEWQTKYVASVNDWWNDLHATSDGGYVVAGSSDICGCGRRVATITKLDSEGRVQWARSYRSTPLRWTEAISFVEMPNGDYLVAGRVDVFSGTFYPPHGIDMELLVFRVDPSGKLIWSAEFMADGFNTPGQIEATPDGGFAIVGTGSSFTGPSTLWFMKFRGDGSLERESSYGNVLDGTGSRLTLMPDGGYLLAGRIFENGFEYSGLWVLRLDASGQIVNQRAFDGRSGFDAVTDLIPVRDGGFIITGGQDIRGNLPTNFLVVKMSPELEVSQGCEKETHAFPATRVSFGALEPLVEETLSVVASPANLTRSETAAGARACHEGVYGPPPVFESVSVQLRERLVACDLTHMLETLICALGIPGTEAIEPVVISGSYDHLQIETHVTDLNSTPELNDVAEVDAELTQSGRLLPSVPLVDDGSSEIVLQEQRSYISEGCFDDPLQGICSCTNARYPIASGDVVPGDSVYSHRDALLNWNSPSLLADCAMKLDHYNSFLVDPASSLDVSIKVSDRIGNVSVWPEPIHLTTGISSFACSGDPCGCCLLRAFQQLVPIEQCIGLDGLPSPTFPCGLCMALPEGTCPP